MTDQADDQADGGRAARADAAETLDRMIDRLFSHWQLNDSDRMALLGLSGRPNERQRADDLIAGSETTERVGNLLAIHAKLRTLFPQNRDLAYAWMSTANHAFNGQTPVAVVREWGLDGLRAVNAYLEHAINN